MYIFPLTLYTRTVRKLLCRVPTKGNKYAWFQKTTLESSTEGRILGENLHEPSSTNMLRLVAVNSPAAHL